MKKDTFYFPHEYNFRNDVRMLHASTKVGIGAMTIYWSLMEFLAEQGGELSLDMASVLARAIYAEESQVLSIIKDFGLFQFNETHFYSEKLNEHLDLRRNLSEKGKEGVRIKEEKKQALKSAQSNTESTPAPKSSNNLYVAKSPPVSPPESIPVTKERKGKEIKEKEIKENEESAKAQHTQEEIDKFKSFNDWIDVNTPRIKQFKQPFTIPEYLRLSEDFSKELIKKTLLAMQNRADVTKKNLSANLTFRNWAARDLGLFDQKSPTTTSGPSAAELKAQRILKEVG